MRREFNAQRAWRLEFYQPNVFNILNDPPALVFIVKDQNIAVGVH